MSVSICPEDHPKIRTRLCWQVSILGTSSHQCLTRVGGEVSPSPFSLVTWGAEVWQGTRLAFGFSHAGPVRGYPTFSCACSGLEGGRFRPSLGKKASFFLPWVVAPRVSHERLLIFPIHSGYRPPAASSPPHLSFPPSFRGNKHSNSSNQVLEYQHGRFI